MKDNDFVQQGDVLIRRVDEVPAGAAPVPLHSRIVLAEGEATGHAHVITDIDNCQMLSLEGQFFLRVNAPVVVTHEEHGQVTVEPGVWQVGIVREYDHFAEEARQVVD